MDMMATSLTRGEKFAAGTLTRVNGIVVHFMIRKTSTAILPGLVWQLWARCDGQEWTLMNLGSTCEDIQAIIDNWGTSVI